jgi:NHS family nucleoside permease-like MFS transporter/NHS family xanthosine MFS transporter
MMMTNGIGATLGVLVAGAIMDKLVFKAVDPDWSKAWFIFAGYVLVVTLLFAVFFKESDQEKKA